MEDMINQRVTSIHAASNLVDCWDNLSIRGFTLSMACSTRVSNIPLLFRNESTTIILDNLKNQLLVDYLIRLNVLYRMLSDISNETGFYFTIDRPLYYGGNINATILVFDSPSLILMPTIKNPNSVSNTYQQDEL